MKWKYITNIDKIRNFAEMFIYDEVGEDKVNGLNFAYELRYLLTYEAITEVKVRINSVGGSVIQGFSIISSIINAKKDYPTISVNTYNDGVAASIAGVIWAVGKNRYMKDYARLMIHGVSINDADMSNLSEKDKAGMSNLQNMIIESFSSSIGVEPSVISDLMENGRDNWFNAGELLKIGFIQKENIENTGFELELPEAFSALAVQNKAKEIINNFKPVTKMKKVTAKLGLITDASEDAAVTAIEQIENRAKTAEETLATVINELEAEKTKNASLQKIADEATKATATALVKNAIKEGKFDAAKEAELIENAVKDLPAFQNMLSFMPTKAKNILNGVDTSGKEAEGLIAKINNRSFRTIEREEPSLLEKLKNEAKGEYVKLYNEQYGTQKTENEF